MSRQPGLPPEYRDQLSADCRDLFYERIVVHLSDIDENWLYAWEEADDGGVPDFSEELDLLLEEIGQAHPEGDGSAEPTRPPEAVRRVIAYLREPSAVDTKQTKGSDALLVAERANRELRAMCERIAKETDREVRAICGRILSAIDRELVAEGQA